MDMDLKQYFFSIIFIFVFIFILHDNNNNGVVMCDDKLGEQLDETQKDELNRISMYWIFFPFFILKICKLFVFTIFIFECLPWIFCNFGEYFYQEKYTCLPSKLHYNEAFWMNEQSFIVLPPTPFFSKGTCLHHCLRCWA